MSTGIVLPALNINAVAPAFSISTLGFMPPNPAVAMSAMHPLRLRKYAEGYWREMMIKHMEEVNRQLKIGWRYLPTFELLTDMLKVPLADKFMCLNPMHCRQMRSVRQSPAGDIEKQ